MKVLRLFFSFRGRLLRGSFAGLMLGLIGAFLTLFLLLDSVAGYRTTWVLYPFFYASLLSLIARRYHDMGFSAARLLVGLIPVFGTLWVLIELFFRRGTPAENRYGPVPVYSRLAYQTVERGSDKGSPNVVVDVTGLYPVEVAAVVVPKTVEEVQAAIQRSTGPISIGGGRFSMGGQTACPQSLHLDMRRLNGVIRLSPLDRTIRVQAGIRWCDLQRFLDVHDFAVKIMQTYANFTVGGSLSVNCHGRYVGLGPLILSVRAIQLVLHDGSLCEATPTENAELFYASIGGYGGVGVIVEAELEVADNGRVKRLTKRVAKREYLEHFKQQVRSQPEAVFHNADLYPPHFRRLRSVTWVETDDFVTNPDRLMRLQPSYSLYRYLFWAVSETPFGKWRREFIFEPLFYSSDAVHWRNYEAGYDVAELEPDTRKWKTYVLQEYFVPIERFEEFVALMGDIFRRHAVNVVNVSVRHAVADPGSYLAWAREESFAFVVYYKQRVEETERGRVAVWTRELIDAVLTVGGAYYLPYQPHATPAQFHRAYPRAKELFELKRRVDPDYRFRNSVWTNYYEPWLADQIETTAAIQQPVSEFRTVFSDVVWRDRFYFFLQTVYRIYPEHTFHGLIAEACDAHEDDEAIYRYVQERLPSIKPLLSELRYALPSLRVQKAVIADQTRELLKDVGRIDGYVEIGTPGRYVKALRDVLPLSGKTYLVHEKEPSNSPVDVMERGGLAKVGSYHPLGDYDPLPSTIGSASIGLVTCYIGLHHAPPERLGDFLDSIHRVLRPGGCFVLREHDAGRAEMKTFVSLVHTVFNAGLGESWATDRKELRHFDSVDAFIERVEAHGFEDLGYRVLQERDPSLNTLVCFKRTDASA